MGVFDSASKRNSPQVIAGLRRGAADRTAGVKEKARDRKEQVSSLGGRLTPCAGGCGRKVSKPGYYCGGKCAKKAGEKI